MPPRHLLHLAPQRALNTIVAAFLLLTTPTLAHSSMPPPAQATISLDSTHAELAPRLRLTLTFHDRMGTAVFAPLTAPLPVDVGAPLSRYRAGDAAYVTAEQSVVVFLTSGTAVPESGLVLLGHVEDGLDDLASCRRDCPVEIVLADASGRKE
ncbi:cyclophilin-like fold protein [Microbacterium sp. NPDC056569]|uniref:cyclophilin-like fold protein n=1 Tax=Microbacterium sp. NPDC056569 TaxID=3345867 RepID=UPI003670D8E3